MELPFYKLVGHDVVSCSMAEYSAAYDEKTRRVGSTHVGEAWVSTVFLGISLHSSILGEQPPLLFETMIFGGPYNESQWRYATWDEAAAGHKRVVAALRAGRNPD